MDKFQALKISDFDHLEFATADLEKASELYLRLGFEKAGSREILERQLKSSLFVQNGINVLLSYSTLRSDPVARYVSQHGEGLIGIGFRCEDAVSTLDLAANRGAEVADSPKSYKKDFGAVQSTSIKSFGDIRHTFVSRQGNLFAEGFDVPIKLTRRPGGLQRIEAVHCYVESEKADASTQFYERVLGLDAKPVSPYSQSMESSNGLIKISVSRPGDPTSRIQDYLDINHGPGIPYVALATDELVTCVQAFLREGVKFSSSPAAANNDSLGSRFPHLAEPLASLRELNMGAESDGTCLHVSLQNAMGPFHYSLVQRFNHHTP